MSDKKDSAEHLVDLIRLKAPEYLDLLTAETDADFEFAFDALLGKAVTNLEKNKKNFKSLDEVGLTAVLASSLTNPGIYVTQEGHSNGRVDIIIEVNYSVPARSKLGEAKIYDGPKYHLKGLKQLLGRYTTGREGRGILIVYVRKKAIANLVKKLRKRMDSERPMLQKGKTIDHIFRWSFISTHMHSSGENMDVGHICCNLHIS